MGLFGGSFDPVHHGHLIVASSLVDALGLDHVRLVVAREQPFKQGAHGASAEDRLAMVRLAVAGARHLRVEGSEVSRAGPSYTAETVEQLTARDPETEWVVLLGGDAAREFHSWRRPEVIQRLASVVVFNRGTFAVPSEFDEVAVPRIGISATTVRQRVQDGQSIQYWVPDAVAKYIATHRLYQSESA